MRIYDLFMKARQESRKLFIPYMTCGDPSLTATKTLVQCLETLGADVIELGVPFSDPVADGPVNQQSALRALKQQVTLTSCCNLVKDLRQTGCRIPIVLFTYFNPILRLGIQSFASKAREVGIDAVLVVDLPIEEAEEFSQQMALHQIGTVFLVTPTTSAERIERIDCISTEFIYYVSRTGVTGVQSELSATLKQEIDHVKAHTTKPLAIGFGVSTPLHAQAVSQLADGVVVGSALVKLLDNPCFNESLAAIDDLGRALRAAIYTQNSAV